MKKNTVIIISGPTASGKTSTSLKLASEIKSQLNMPATVVNFDSLIFYKELNIGTAKPEPEELAAVPHELVNISSAKDPINASDYIKLATPIINKLHQENHVVLLVGGSGFYLRALLKGMYQGQQTSEDVTQKADKLYKEQGIAPFLEILKEHDPESFEALHENDHYRVIRAVEFFWSTGKKISLEKKAMQEKDPYNLLDNIHKDWEVMHIHLDLPKEEHLDIIQQRTDKMIHMGLVDEVKTLLKNGFTGEEKPLQSIGYKEVVDYLKNGFSSLEECVERIVISTRQLAKAQRTWFKKVHQKEVYHPINDCNKIIETAISFIKS